MSKKTLLTVITTIFLLTTGPLVQAATTYYVDGANGNDNNDCLTPNTACKTINTLDINGVVVKGALSKVNDGDTVKIAPSVYLEIITLDSNNITIEGTGARASDVVIDGNGANSTIFNSTASNIKNLTLKNNGGQAVQNTGNLLLEKLILTGKNTTGSCGGAIRTSQPGVLTLKDSIVTGSTTKDSGGGICASGSINIINSTISGNEAPGDPNYAPAGTGGGIYVWGGTVHIYNSTITKNKAKNQGGGIMSDPNTGFVLTMDNSIVSDNLANNHDENCNGIIIQSGSFNIEKGTTCNNPNIPTLFPLHSDPMLDTLKDNGGPTTTHALLAGSPAINAGDPNGCKGPGNTALDTDQRGQIRVERCDMGSFEYVPPGWVPPTPPGPGTPGTPGGGGTPQTPGGTPGTGTSNNPPGGAPQTGGDQNVSDEAGGCTLQKGE